MRFFFSYRKQQHVVFIMFIFMIKSEAENVNA